MLRGLAEGNGNTRILVGSNGGETARETVEDLIRLAGPPRSNLRIGVVSFSDGLFHPKVYHFIRADGTMSAYVGSGNFTYSGVSGKNVEAGITLDTRDGDNGKVLLDILDAVDAWFVGNRPGLFPVGRAFDLTQLVNAGVLGVPSSHNAAARAAAGGDREKLGSALAGLLRLPAISKPMVLPAVISGVGASVPLTSTPPVVPPFVEWWSKRIESSDAQRKPTGNQSGVIVLTQANRRGQIDQTTFFRNNLFGGQVWQQALTRTASVKDVAQVPMHVTVLGEYLGVRVFEVTHDNVREANQNNYTATMSLGPIRDEFDRVDMREHTIVIGRDAAGEYWCDIS